MAATSRGEQDMKRKCEEACKTTKDPLELLRLKCLARGASGIKSIARYHVVRKQSFFPVIQK